MATTKPPVLTPMRSPMPPRRAPVGVGARWGASKAAAGAAAASSSEKETPTVVFTENSPHSNIRGSGERVVASWAKPEKLFEDDDSDESSSSPKSEADPSEGRDVDEDEDGSSEPSDGVNDGTRESRATRRGNDDDGGDDDVSSDDSEGSRHRKVVSIIQNVLEMGIASVCRLRKIFPPCFYQKYDSPYDGTTITQFNVGALRRMCMGEGECEDEDKGENISCQSDNEEPDDEASREKKQKSLSPLTESSQKYNDGTGSSLDRAAYTNEEKRMAMEALLLLRWMQKGGVNEILRDGNLARLVFGICVPSEETSGGANNDELVESYSFNISYKRPENPGEVEEDEVNEAVGCVFQNLNGFQAGRSLSQSVVPSKTQASFLSLSQSSRAPSYGDGSQTQMSSMDFFPRSQMEMSQKSLMESMSQSIRVSVKKNRGRTIPRTRYLTLRVEFMNSMSPNELPPSLKQNCLETSPVSIVGGNSGESSSRGSKHHTDRFIVTPLGRISETGYSGVCVDMVAKTKVNGNEDYEDKRNRMDFVPGSIRPKKCVLITLKTASKVNEEICRIILITLRFGWEARRSDSHMV
ncbi:hypothetical protein ACHAW5_006820 [Stephanodiscus triporus]|uniref:HORMA domain-containing protein n=1 Tax=Stephanodiscus triporus TaxID=2934178 RepID=A0ABD3PY08_9STRA